MDMKTFVEQTFQFRYQPQYIVPQLEKNTNTMKYYLWRPFKSGFGQSEFCFNTELKRYFRIIPSEEFDCIDDDTFS
jgi:hypothetical protein